MESGRVALAGATGRMGRAILGALQHATDLRLSGALCDAGDPQLGEDAGLLEGSRQNVTLSADLAACLQGAQVLIDFTVPHASLKHLDACTQLGIPMVIGTTGFSANQKAHIGEAAQQSAVVLAPNMSVGVNLSMALLALAARALGDDYDVEIIEAHHRNKLDAPSGTALQMGEVIASARGTRLEGLRLASREGHTGVRPRGQIGFSAIRGGDIIGDHTVLFAGEGERIEITHRSSSRAAYADGALRAARFVMGKKSGLYTMRDVLNLPQL